MLEVISMTTTAKWKAVACRSVFSERYVPNLVLISFVLKCTATKGYIKQEAVAECLKQTVCH